MDWIVIACFPLAIHTADRFHFQKVVTEAVQEMRIEIRREVIDKENKKILEIKAFNKKHVKEINDRKVEKQIYKPKTYYNWDTERQLIARWRYLLYKPSSQWNKWQKQRAEILFNEYPELKKVYNLTMYFRSIFHHSSIKNIWRERLYAWYDKIEESKNKKLISASETIKAHEWRILNYFNNRASNASAESFNAKLKGFRSLIRWINDFNFFLFRVEKLYA